MDGSKPVDAIKEAEGNQISPIITVYKGRDFTDDSSVETGGYEYVGTDWNDKISSFKIHAGEFEFYGAKDHGTEDWGPVRLKVGEYPWVGDVGIRNDTISSWKAFYGFGTPAPPAPAEGPASDYAGIVFKNDGTCGRDGQASYIYNKHPTERIRVTYHDVASPDKIEEADMPPNSESYKGCHLYVAGKVEYIS